MVIVANRGGWPFIRRQDQAAIRAARKTIDGALDIGAGRDRTGHKFNRDPARQSADDHVVEASSDSSHQKWRL